MSPGETTAELTAIMLISERKRVFGGLYLPGRLKGEGEIGYFPWNFGARFSAKAVTPSLKSWLPKRDEEARDS